MVYMAADNGMADQSYIDLDKLQRAGSTSEVNIVVQVDHPATDSLPFVHRYLVKKDTLDMLQALPAEDMADPATLSDFVRFTKDHYPADNYILDLWDHGDGWTARAARGHDPNPPRAPRGQSEEKESLSLPGVSGAAPLSSRGSCLLTQDSGSCPQTEAIIYDGTSDHWMSVAGGEFKTALDDARDILGQKVAILEMDACLMQMLEVGYEARDAVELMVSSEDLMPYNGFPYEEFLEALTARPTMTPREYAMALPGIFAQYYGGGSPDTEDATLSSLDLTLLDPAVAQLDSLLDAVAARAPSSAFRLARDSVQTFSSMYIPPTRYDDNIDLINWLDLLPEPLTPDPRPRFQAMVLAHASTGTTLARSGGIAIWYPDNYLTLKVRHVEYEQLDWAHADPWLHFLNCYFADDDVKPTTSTVAPPQVGGRNDYRVCWQRADDLAPVTYQLREAGGLTQIFDDPCEDLSNWVSDGFTLSNTETYSGNYSFFSGIGSNLDNTITTLSPLAIPHGGLFSLYAWVNTLETQDTSGALHRDIAYVEISSDTITWTVLDSLYGYNSDWLACRYFLPDAPAPGYWLRIRFRTGGGAHQDGVYIDDIKVQAFGSWRMIDSVIRDTSYYIFDVPRDTFYYAVAARDSFGNLGYVSNLQRVAVPDYAEPYTVPNPITREDLTQGVSLVCDFPAGETPDVLIYTLSGELVWQADKVTSHQILWPATNGQGKPLASGIYLLVVNSKTFHRIGKFAIVR